MPEFSPLDYESLSNTVYSAMCDALMQGRFQPGERLKIRDLAEQFGTSVTPIRDAILRLANDEALIFRSPRDIRIPDMKQARYREIRSIRVKLEGLAAETAAQTATAKDIAALEQVLRDNEQAIADGDGLKGAALNQAFHFMLPQIAGLPVLNGILRRLWLQMGPHISDVYIPAGRAMIDHHYPVVDALKRHDSAAAAMAIIDDILLGGKPILERITTREEN
ncbi:GntR family transcriptional regulator [Agrobacterium larrymoorei]|uniref:GntR family transcriptional regulator n=1 Tax=Agrobacterium larrymoorei TaxID=160699 RepID=A0A4D7E0G0_9HYPH|nr:GntR family transcriptional regulator [Agrobacterium larrymoorei]QCJ00795.1 GntR family transcriptional regulator [Agrobacterium larrymoorei]QYA10456.1 GntR family transcriptional regulator [Agrobacterium larrymoorei]WHA43943.1 GntR family transcriptional regulator [Agrobacterium larrymoorei]